MVFVGGGRQGFDFLGFHCRKLESWTYRGHRYLQRWPGRRAIQRIRDRIKAITAPRHRLPEPVGPIVAEINQAVRGWGAYFRVGNSSRKFAQVDDYVRERLALFLSKKTGQHGRHQERYTYAYFKRLGVHRLVGTVKWYVAMPIATR
jgi:RNA-directed DNA polymerase